MSLNAQQKASATKAFQLADDDNTGNLTSLQFYNATKNLNLGYSFAEAFEIYKQFDKDGDFFVDLEEFHKFLGSTGLTYSRVDLSHAVNHKVATGKRASWRPNSVRDTLTSSNMVSTQAAPVRTSHTTLTEAPVVRTSHTTYTEAPVVRTSHTIQAPARVSHTYSQAHVPVQHISQTTYSNGPAIFTSNIQQAPVTTTHVRHAPAPVQTTYLAPAKVQTRNPRGSQPRSYNYESYGALARYDGGYKGYMVRNELRSACHDLGVSCSTELQLTNLFNEINESGTGKITAQEFQPFYEYVQTSHFKSQEPWGPTDDKILAVQASVENQIKPEIGGAHLGAHQGNTGRY